MKRIARLAAAVAAVTGVVAYMVPTSGQADGEAAPIFGFKIHAGYRDWSLISVAHVGGNLNDLRVELGNDATIKAYREGKLRFPDGLIIARLAWHQVTSEENNSALRRTLERGGLSPEETTKLLAESFVAGAATHVQFMVMDSGRYASTAGWGFAQFTDRKPDGEALHKTCFSCHEPAKDRDFVFTR
jgi:hypothetical protein